MHFRLRIPLMLCFLIACAAIKAQDFCVRAKNLAELINANHVAPQNINDSFSERVFTCFLALLDPEKIYLTRSDSAALHAHRYKIDDQLMSGTCTFITDAAALYNIKVKASQKFTDSILQRPLQYNLSETYGFFQTRSFCNKTTDLKKRRIAGLTYRILERSWKMAKLKNEKLGPSNFPVLEKAAREKEKTRVFQSSAKILNHPGGLNGLLEEYLLKAIAMSYDPHTEYFTPAEKARFEKAIQASALSFGFAINQNPLGEMEISHLTPGGPAWNSNELKKGDVLLKLKFNDQPSRDAADLEQEEILELLDDTNLATGEFTIRKSDGQLKTVALKKEKTENVENLISSFVLEGKKKVGYISLPGFYTSENDQSGQGCAGDVAKELLKLKKEGITGLVLDLRFNGGGSVQEAIDLAGIFVDGPVAVMQTKGSLLSTLKDANKGTAFDGPIVVLINAYSASASELVAAALQDLNRAVIVGCPSFGKATGQLVLPLDKSSFRPAPKGFIKITEFRLYRVTGSSLQFSGVIPDIPMPEITQYLVEHESSLPYALTPEKISKKVYYTALTALPVSTLKETTESNVSRIPYFGNIRKLGEFLHRPVPLQFDDFTRYMTDLDVLFSDLNKREEAGDHYKVYVSGLNQALFAVDSFHREISNSALEDIKRSFYIREAYDILTRIQEK